MTEYRDENENVEKLQTSHIVVHDDSSVKYTFKTVVRDLHFCL